MRSINFHNITEFNQAQNLPEPENPLFSIGHTKLNPDEIEKCDFSQEEASYTNHFYVISFKNIISGEIIYGRTKYDGSTGTMLFTAPMQTLVAKDVVISSESWFIVFHEDFVRGLDIQKRIKNYNFFKYNVNEALHLSPKEEQTLKTIFRNIEAEYQNNQDDFSKEIIISHLETLLKYSDRFYKRQFLNRKEINLNLMTRFKEVLDTYFESGQQMEKGIPTVNLYLIEEAKNLLLTPNASISETAYKLGFEYSQYFSRLFKKKTGISPKEYIESASLN